MKICTGYEIAWDYDHQIFTLQWEINGVKSFAFKTRGSCANEIRSPEQVFLENEEAVLRGEIGKDYLNGQINRTQANRELLNLRFLGPKNPTAHLLTLAEFALGLKK